MNPDVPEALAQLQNLLASQGHQQGPPELLLNLASTLAMQSLLANPSIVSAAKMLLSGMAAPGAPGSLLENPLASGLLLQQYAAIARGGDFQASLKRTLEQELGPRKRALEEPSSEPGSPPTKQVFDDTGRVPMSKEDFDDCLDKVLREEFTDEGPKDSPIASDSSSISSFSEIKEVVSPSDGEGSLSLRDILDFNWGDNSSSAFRKVSRSTSSSSPTSLPMDSPDWITISPPGGSSGRSSTSSTTSSDSMCDPPPAPMPPELTERIRAVAREMMARGAVPSIPAEGELGDQLEKMPPIWRGKLVIKNLTEVAVQMHIMCGEKDYMMDALGPVTAAERSPKDGQPALRIVQRMRAEGHGLYSLLHRLQKHGATCLCVPIGRSKEEMREHSLLLKNSFSDYFLKKGCAGVVNVNATETTPPSLVYVFPPNEFTDVYMSECAPLLLDKLKLKEADDFSYLFVAIAPQGTPAD